MVDTIRYVDADAPGGGSGGELDPYNLLSTWNANEAGTVGAGDRHICYFRSGTNTDPSRVNLAGWNGAGELILQRWPGAAQAVLKPSGGSGQAIDSPPDMQFTVEHIDIDMSDMFGTSEEGVRILGDCNIRKVRFANGVISQMDFIHYGTLSTTESWITDCCFHSVNRSFILNQAAPNQTSHVINCVAWNCLGTQSNAPGIGFQIGGAQSGANATIINTACHMANATPCYGVGSGSWMTADSGYNRASDGTHTVVGPGSVGNVIFQEGTGGSGERAMYISLSEPYDFHIHDVPDNSVRDTGIGPDDPQRGPYVPLFDWDGDPRSGLTADIGFDQIVDSGPGIITEMQIDLDQNNLMSAQSLANLNVESDLQQISQVTGAIVLQADVASNVLSSTQINTSRTLTMNAQIALEQTEMLALAVNLQRVAHVMQMVSSALILKSGQSSDQEITLFDQQNIQFGAGLGFDALITLGYLESLGLDSDSGVGALVVMQSQAQTNYAALRVLEQQIDLSSIVDLSQAIEATLIAQTNLSTIGDLALLRVIETEGRVAFYFDAQMITDRLGPETITIETDEGRTILISKENRTLVILLEKRDILIE